MWPGAAAAVIGPAMARTIDVVIGTDMSAPSMATMPRHHKPAMEQTFSHVIRLPHIIELDNDTSIWVAD